MVKVLELLIFYFNGMDKNNFLRVIINEIYSNLTMQDIINKFRKYALNQCLLDFKIEPFKYDIYF